MELTKAIEYYGKNVQVVCVDGDVVSGLLGSYQTFADEPDEPESISLFVEDCAIEIPVVEITEIKIS
ncbi:MAG: hypothetical protein RSB04_07805 [Gordonibacter sp.]|uniref:hypothetical protein n=1 Tax=Gordonibacter sp. TaxID=1968902 RepID=UPI002FCB5752